MKHEELLKAVEVAKTLLDGSVPIDVSGAAMVLDHALKVLDVQIGNVVPQIGDQGK